MLQLHGHLERGCWTALAFLCLSLASSGTLSATPLCFAAPGDVTTLGVSAKAQVISRLTESPLPRMNRKKSAANTKVKIQVKIKNNKFVLQLIERLGRKSGWGWYSTRACTYSSVVAQHGGGGRTEGALQLLNSRREPGTRMSVLLANPDYLLEGFAEKTCQVCANLLQ